MNYCLKHTSLQSWKVSEKAEFTKVEFLSEGLAFNAISELLVGREVFDFCARGSHREGRKGKNETTNDRKDENNRENKKAVRKKEESKNE